MMPASPAPGDGYGESSPFFYPSYVGSKGWIGVVVSSTTDWSEIAELVDDSYRLTAPKRLVAILDG